MASARGSYRVFIVEVEEGLDPEWLRNPFHDDRSRSDYAVTCQRDRKATAFGILADYIARRRRLKYHRTKFSTLYSLNVE